MPLLEVSSYNAMLKQILLRTSFLLPPFHRWKQGSSEQQVAEQTWMWPFSAREHLSPGSPGCTPGWDGSHCTGPQPSLHPCCGTAWQRHCTVGNSKAKAKSFKQCCRQPSAQSFFQGGFAEHRSTRSAWRAVQVVQNTSNSGEKPLSPPFSSVCLWGRTSEPNP